MHTCTFVNLCWVFEYMVTLPVLYVSLVLIQYKYVYSINELLYSHMSVRVKKIVCKFTFKGEGGKS